MIDTIEIELFDLVKHKWVIDYLRLSSKSDYKTFETAKPEEILQPHLKGKKFLHQIVLSKDTLTEVVRQYSKEGSSNYNLKFRIKDRDTPEFSSLVINFSVPKYFYGDNVHQFIHSPLDPRWSRAHGIYDSLETHLSMLHKYVNGALEKFFHYHFPVGNIDYELIRIKRLDICYNLLFDKQDDCLSYFDKLFVIAKKGFGEMNGGTTPYGRETIFFYTSAYSAKVYYKGADFAKHDYARIKRYHEILQLMKKPPYSNGVVRTTYNVDDNDVFSSIMRKDGTEDIVYTGILNNKRDAKSFTNTKYVDAIADVANRTLRYEMTFRSEYMSYLLNHSILKHPNYDWKVYKKLFNQIKGMCNKIVERDKDGFIIPERRVVKAKGIRKVNTGLKFTVENYSYFKEIIESLKDLHLLKGNMALLFLREYPQMRWYNGFDIVKADNAKRSQLAALENFYHRIEGFYGKQQFFVMGNSVTMQSDFNHMNSSCNVRHPKRYFFSKELCTAMAARFLEFVDNFSIKNFPQEDRVFEAIKACKNGGKNKLLSLEKLQLIYYARKSGKPLKALRSELNMSKASYYRYKKFFEVDLQILENTFEFPFNPEYDFQKYYNLLFENQYFRQNVVTFL